MEPSQLELEIREQPQVLERLVEERGRFEQVARAILRRSPKFVVLVARGSSDNAARYAQYLFGVRNGLPVALATPSLFTLYGRPPRLQDSLVLAISQSGQSPDIVAVVEEGRRQGALTVALSNERSSPLAMAAEHGLALLAGAERSVAATKTYTASLMAMALLSTAMGEDGEAMAQLAAVPRILRGVLELETAIRQMASAHEKAQACVVISRGFNYATAFEIALKLKELTYVLAEPYSSADFFHGPVALVEGGFLVVSILPEGQVGKELAGMVRTLRDRGAEIVGISPDAESLSIVQHPIPLPQGIPEWISPLVTVVPGQIFALGLALAKGLDPDRPRTLSKVTLTL
jgi:glutamine---fructose-6-phosphate transaminase (isomerizing)